MRSGSPAFIRRPRPMRRPTRKSAARANSSATKVRSRNPRMSRVPKNPIKVPDRNKPKRGAARVAGLQGERSDAADPLWLKLAYTAFVAAIVPVYVRQYGWRNFLWFSDVAVGPIDAGVQPRDAAEFVWRVRACDVDSATVPFPRD